MRMIMGLAANDWLAKSGGQAHLPNPKLLRLAGYVPIERLSMPDRKAFKPEITHKSQSLKVRKVGLPPLFPILISQIAALFSASLLVVAPIFSADTLACMNSKR
jgi:hypothetical protein